MSTDDKATTSPIDLDGSSTIARLAIRPAWKDPQTGALYVHRDLDLAQDPWVEEQHIRPVKAAEKFGDVDSFCAYVKRFTAHDDEPPFLTFCARGLRGLLDYHQSDGNPGRCQWTAEHPFVTSRQWRAWMELANGQPRSQKVAIEALEDLGEDIQEPKQADLMALLRSLRASVNAKADAELRPDGTISVRFEKDQTVKAGAAGAVDLPPSIKVAIPVLKGHVDEEGRPVRYALQIRVRVSVDDNARLMFRFSAPTAEQVLEDALADRVQAAKALLGEGLPLLRAAD